MSDREREATVTGYAVANCDTVVHCESLEEACRVAEGWFPDSWDVCLDPTAPVDVTNARIRRAFGPGHYYEGECPTIRPRFG